MPPAIAGGLRPGLTGGMVSSSPSSTSRIRRTRVPFRRSRTVRCAVLAAVFCGAMANGGWSFKTILRTLGGPARGAVRSGRCASGAGYTVVTPSLTPNAVCIAAGSAGNGPVLVQLNFANAQTPASPLPPSQRAAPPSGSSSSTSPSFHATLPHCRSLHVAITVTSGHTQCTDTSSSYTIVTSLQLCHTCAVSSQLCTDIHWLVHVGYAVCAATISMHDTLLY